MVPSCTFVPNLQPSDAVDLENCTTIDNSENEQDVVYLFRVLHKVKKGTVGVSLHGFGLDCSPANGMAMFAISITGNPIPCKAYAGDQDMVGYTTCTYFCRCSSGCVMFRVTILLPGDKVICAFVV